MRKVLLGVGALVVVGAIAFAVLFFRHSQSHPSPAVEQSRWVVSATPPGRAVRFALLKPFGAWHLMCTQLDQAPKPGDVQNLGPEPGVAARRAGPCQVGIRMQDEAAPNQMMYLGFRYRSEAIHPDVFVFYVTLGKPNVTITAMGQLVDLDKKEKPRGGGFLGKLAPRNPGYQEARAQDLHLQLGAQSLTIPTVNCRRARCIARYRSADIGTVAPGAKIVLRLPGPPHGKPRTIDVPSDGLNAALVELRQRSGV